MWRGQSLYHSWTLDRAGLRWLGSSYRQMLDRTEFVTKLCTADSQDMRQFRCCLRETASSLGYLHVVQIS